jgi:hypothetical protein
MFYIDFYDITVLFIIFRNGTPVLFGTETSRTNRQTGMISETVFTSKIWLPER